MQSVMKKDISSLPFEIIQEIASYLPKTTNLNWRKTSRKFSCALTASVFRHVELRLDRRWIGRLSSISNNDHLRPLVRELRLSMPQRHLLKTYCMCGAVTQSLNRELDRPIASEFGARQVIDEWRKMKSAALTADIARTLDLFTRLVGVRELEIDFNLRPCRKNMGWFCQPYLKLFRSAAGQFKNLASL